MSPAAEILVIILSVFLAIFLVLGIILSVYLIKLTRDIRAVTRSAGRTVGHIESAVSGFTKITSPLFLAEIIGKYIKKFNKKRRGE
jgi:uncharacterized protein YoxC